MDKHSGKTPRIFISHSSKDNTFGKRIVRDLRDALGSDDAVWYDTQGGLNGGDVWWDKIVQELARCTIFIIVASPEAMDSIWTRREFLIAQNEGKDIIYILYRKCTIWPDLKIIHAINFLSPITYQASFEELLKVIGAPQRKKKPPSPQGTLLLTYDIHTSWLGSVAWSPDGSRIASGGGDGTVRVWDAFTGETLRTYRGHQGMLSEIWSIIWSPDSKCIASAGNRAAIQVWNPLNGQKIAAYKGHSHLLPIIASMAWSPDGESIASTNFGSGLNDAAIHIWEARTGQKKSVIGLRSRLPNISLNSILGGVSWAPDNRRIVCGLKGEVLTFDINTGRQLRSYKSNSDKIYFYVGWAPDGARIACATSEQAEIWDTTNDTKLLTYVAHKADIRKIAWSPDGRYIATASNDKTVHIWDPDTGTRIFTYEKHTGEVASLSWSPDSTRIASACKDGTVHVWQAI